MRRRLTRERRRGLGRSLALFIVHTATKIVQYCTQVVTVPGPCLSLLNLGHRGTVIHPREVSGAVRLHHVAKSKLHSF